MNVLFADTTHPALPTLLSEAGFVVDEGKCTDKEACLAIIDRYDGIIIRSKFIIDRPFLDKATNLKFIGRVGAGMENIDTEYARQRGVLCFNSPEGNRDAVGEQTVGMLLMLQNNLLRANSEVKNGIWKREENRGVEIGGKTIGIIGFGNMGSTVAKKLRGFDMNILAYDKYKTNYAPDYVTETNLKTLFQQCDVVSIHVPLTEETHYMCNTEFFNAFEKPIVFINTARGKVLKTSALVHAMEQGKVVGACLDVLEYEAVSFENIYREKLPADFQYLCDNERAILSPHIAGWTQESNIKLSSLLAKKIVDAFGADATK
ncbi:MAG: NAD(P)-dependent oxidoreductase [Salinivirgaceae bacterium]|jgi:D-3-phosphoglycerate dehydrogenase|nr:NAD(P)-dependent oxidoreductase [Salinivirgaceae bacterium]